MSTFSLVVGSVLWILVLASLWMVVVRDDKGADGEGGTDGGDTATSGAVSSGEADQGDAIEAKPKSIVISFPTRQLPEFEFPECLGGSVSRDSMKGQRWLASFVFTRCVETCPVITRNVSDLHKRVAESNPDFRFVTFSVDSSFDTAEVLKKYAETFQADHERWKFLTGDENEIHDLIRRGFAQFVQTNLGEMRKPGFEVAHSNRAVLVNEDGVPVATYLMTDPEHVVKLRRVIEGKVEFPVAGPPLDAPSDGSNPPLSLNIVPVQQEAAASDEASPDEDEAEKPADEGMPDAVAPEENSPEEVQSSSGSEVPADASPVSGEESAESRNEKIQQNLPLWVARLPGINATLNSVCTVLLIAGYIAIRLGQRTMHRNLMVSAFLVSVVFLGCYLTYHEALYKFTGERGRAFVGSEFATVVYRSILIPHVILAVFVPILAIRVFVHAWRKRWDDHRRLARITLPVWLFVSITGVVIYWMLYHWPWRNAAETVASHFLPYSSRLSALPVPN